MISQNPQDQFRILKLTRSEVTYLINKTNTEEFYVFPDRIEQSQIADRLYSRSEFTVQGRYLEMKPEKKYRASASIPARKQERTNKKILKTYTKTLKCDDLRDSLYSNIRAMRGFQKMVTSYTDSWRSLFSPPQ